MDRSERSSRETQRRASAGADSRSAAAPLPDRSARGQALQRLSQVAQLRKSSYAEYAKFYPDEISETETDAELQEMDKLTKPDGRLAVSDKPKDWAVIPPQDAGRAAAKITVPDLDAADRIDFSGTDFVHSGLTKAQAAHIGAVHELTHLHVGIQNRKAKVSDARGMMDSFVGAFHPDKIEQTLQPLRTELLRISKKHPGHPREVMFAIGRLDYIETEKDRTGSNAEAAAVFSELLSWMEARDMQDTPAWEGFHEAVLELLKQALSGPQDDFVPPPPD